MRFEASRRRFLQSLLTTSVALPLSMGGMANLALAAGNPRLKVVFAVIPDGFGVDNDLWYPTVASGVKDTTTFTLNEMSQHLGTYANQSLFLGWTLLGSGTGGHNAWQTILRDSASTMTSIDVLLGNKMPGTNASLKRLYSGPHAMVGATWNISYQDNTMIRPEDNPYNLHNAVFGGAGSSGGSSGSTTADRTHLFNPARTQLQTLRDKLGAAEKAKLVTHLDAMEQLAVDMQATLPPANTCEPSASAPATGMDINSADYRDEVTRAHANIVANALSCGSSRVATFQIGRSADQVVIKSVSTSRNPHDCSHRYGSDAEFKGSRAWYVKQVKYLLDRLSALPDPDMPGDNLLKHTLVVFTSEMADGAAEHMQDVPVTLIGGASGLLKNGSGSGRYYNLKDYGDRSHWKMGKAVDMQRIWATVAKAAGTSVPYGGNVDTLPNIFTNV